MRPLEKCWLKGGFVTRGQFDAATVAVVCVECQNGVLGPDAVLPTLTAETADLIGNLSRLLDAARATGVRVVHATYGGALGGNDTGTARIWRTLGPATAGWASGSAATQVIPELLAACRDDLKRFIDRMPGPRQPRDGCCLEQIGSAPQRFLSRLQRHLRTLLAATACSARPNGELRWPTASRSGVRSPRPTLPPEM
jgi:hypothetical protein